MDQLIQILDLFRQIKQSGETLKFMNLYKGVSITYEGSIVEISENALRCQVPKYQVLCMQMEGLTYIQATILPEVVRAKIFSADPLAEQVVLTGFEYVGGTIGNRMQIRVQPKEPVKVLLQNKLGVQTELIELSLYGLSVYISPSQFDWRLYRRDAKVNVEFHLPEPQTGKLQSIRLTGIIKYVSVNKSLRYIRLGIFTNPDANTEAFLSKYIAYRQADILKEIKAALQAQFTKNTPNNS